MPQQQQHQQELNRSRALSTNANTCNTTSFFSTSTQSFTTTAASSVENSSEQQQGRGGGQDANSSNTASLAPSSPNKKTKLAAAAAVLNNPLHTSTALLLGGANYANRIPALTYDYESNPALHANHNVSVLSDEEEDNQNADENTPAGAQQSTLGNANNKTTKDKCQRHQRTRSPPNPSAHRLTTGSTNTNTHSTNPTRHNKVFSPPYLSAVERDRLLIVRRFKAAMTIERSARQRERDAFEEAIAAAAGGVGGGGGVPDYVEEAMRKEEEEELRILQEMVTLQQRQKKSTLPAPYPIAPNTGTSVFGNSNSKTTHTKDDSPTRQSDTVAKNRSGKHAAQHHRTTRDDTDHGGAADDGLTVRMSSIAAEADKRRKQLLAHLIASYKKAAGNGLARAEAVKAYEEDMADTEEELRAGSRRIRGEGEGDEETSYSSPQQTPRVAKKKVLVFDSRPPTTIAVGSSPVARRQESLRRQTQFKSNNGGNISSLRDSSLPTLPRGVKDGASLWRASRSGGASGYFNNSHGEDDDGEGRTMAISADVLCGERLREKVLSEAEMYSAISVYYSLLDVLGGMGEEGEGSRGRYAPSSSSDEGLVHLAKLIAAAAALPTSPSSTSPSQRQQQPLDASEIHAQLKTILSLTLSKSTGSTALADDSDAAKDALIEGGGHCPSSRHHHLAAITRYNTKVRRLQRAVHQCVAGIAVGSRALFLLTSALLAPSSSASASSSHHTTMNSIGKGVLRSAAAHAQHQHHPSSPSHASNESSSSSQQAMLPPSILPSPPTSEEAAFLLHGVGALRLPSCLTEPLLKNRRQSSSWSSSMPSPSLSLVPTSPSGRRRQRRDDDDGDDGDSDSSKAKGARSRTVSVPDATRSVAASSSFASSASSSSSSSCSDGEDSMLGFNDRREATEGNANSSTRAAAGSVRSDDAPLSLLQFLVILDECKRFGANGGGEGIRGGVAVRSVQSGGGVTCLSPAQPKAAHFNSLNKPTSHDNVSVLLAEALQQLSGASTNRKDKGAVKDIWSLTSTKPIFRLDSIEGPLTALLAGDTIGDGSRLAKKKRKKTKSTHHHDRGGHSGGAASSTTTATTSTLFIMRLISSAAAPRNACFGEKVLRWYAKRDYMNALLEGGTSPEAAAMMAMGGGNNNGVTRTLSHTSRNSLVCGEANNAMASTTTAAAAAGRSASNRSRLNACAASSSSSSDDDDLTMMGMSAEEEEEYDENANRPPSIAVAWAIRHAMAVEEVSAFAEAEGAAAAAAASHQQQRRQTSYGAVAAGGGGGGGGTSFSSALTAVVVGNTNSSNSGEGAVGGLTIAVPPGTAATAAAASSSPSPAAMMLKARDVINCGIMTQKTRREEAKRLGVVLKAMHKETRRNGGGAMGDDADAGDGDKDEATARKRRGKLLVTLPELLTVLTGVGVIGNQSSVAAPSSSSPSSSTSSAQITAPSYVDALTEFILLGATDPAIPGHVAAMLFTHVAKGGGLVGGGRNAGHAFPSSSSSLLDLYKAAHPFGAAMNEGEGEGERGGENSFWWCDTLEIPIGYLLHCVSFRRGLMPSEEMPPPAAAGDGGSPTAPTGTMNAAVGGAHPTRTSSVGPEGSSAAVVVVANASSAQPLNAMESSTNDAKKANTHSASSSSLSSPFCYSADAIEVTESRFMDYVLELFKEAGGVPTSRALLRQKVMAIEHARQREKRRLKRQQDKAKHKQKNKKSLSSTTTMQQQQEPKAEEGEGNAVGSGGGGGGGEGAALVGRTNGDGSSIIVGNALVESFRSPTAIPVVGVTVAVVGDEASSFKLHRCSDSGMASASAFNAATPEKEGNATGGGEKTSPSADENTSNNSSSGDDDDDDDASSDFDINDDPLFNNNGDGDSFFGDFDDDEEGDDDEDLWQVNAVDFPTFLTMLSLHALNLMHLGIDRNATRGGVGGGRGEGKGAAAEAGSNASSRQNNETGSPSPSSSLSVISSHQLRHRFIRAHQRAVDDMRSRREAILEEQRMHLNLLLPPLPRPNNNDADKRGGGGVSPSAAGLGGGGGEVSILVSASPLSGGRSRGTSWSPSGQNDFSSAAGDGLASPSTLAMGGGESWGGGSMSFGFGRSRGVSTMSHFGGGGVGLGGNDVNTNSNGTPPYAEIAANRMPSASFFSQQSPSGNAAAAPPATPSSTRVRGRTMRLQTGIGSSLPRYAPPPRFESQKLIDAVLRIQGPDPSTMKSAFEEGQRKLASAAVARAQKLMLATEMRLIGMATTSTVAATTTDDEGSLSKKRNNLSSPPEIVVVGSHDGEEGSDTNTATDPSIEESRRVEEDGNASANATTTMTTTRKKGGSLPPSSSFSTPPLPSSSSAASPPSTTLLTLSPLRISGKSPLRRPGVAASIGLVPIEKLEHQHIRTVPLELSRGGGGGGKGGDSNNTASPSSARSLHSQQHPPHPPPLPCPPPPPLAVRAVTRNTTCNEPLLSVSSLSSPSQLSSIVSSLPRVDRPSTAPFRSKTASSSPSAAVAMNSHSNSDSKDGSEDTVGGGGGIIGTTHRLPSETPTDPLIETTTPSRSNHHHQQQETNADDDGKAVGVDEEEVNDGHVSGPLCFSPPSSSPKAAIRDGDDKSSPRNRRHTKEAGEEVFSRLYGRATIPTVKRPVTAATVNLRSRQQSRSEEAAAAAAHGVSSSPSVPLHAVGPSPLDNTLKETPRRNEASSANADASPSSGAQGAAVASPLPAPSPPPTLSQQHGATPPFHRPLATPSHTPTRSYPRGFSAAAPSSLSSSSRRRYRFQQQQSPHPHANDEEAFHQQLMARYTQQLEYATGRAQ